MEMYDIIAQAIGIGAMAMNCFSFRQKSKRAFSPFSFSA